MARVNTIKVLRTTRANLNTQAGLGNLLAGEPYLITDESRLAVATSTSAYKAFVREDDPSVPKAWGLITVSAGVPTLAAGFNIASIVDTATGNVTINLTVPFASTNYVVVASARNNVSAEEVTHYSISTVSQFALLHSNGSGSLADPVSWSFACFGSQ